MKVRRIVFLAFCAIVLLNMTVPDTASTRPEFARLTGQGCGSCHVSPLGGGPLNMDGQQFRENLSDMDVSMDPMLRLSTGQKLLYILLWLIHIPFGVAWIGLFIITFLPALRRGILVIPPKPYIRQMLYSIIIIAATGPTIVYLKFRIMPDLLGTRFGVLMILKIVAALTLLTATLVLVWHTTVLLSRRYRELVARVEEGQALSLPPEDLQLFDGSEKRDALVAVHGNLYDVTGRNLWRKGIHPGGHRAGQDLTGYFADAPHGKEVFDRVTPVGRLLAEPLEKRPKPSWAITAGFVASVVILVVVVLWRW
jgi:predicted heme/steroid binding protein